MESELLYLESLSAQTAQISVLCSLTLTCVGHHKNCCYAINNPAQLLCKMTLFYTLLSFIIFIAETMGSESQRQGPKKDRITSTVPNENS